MMAPDSIPGTTRERGNAPRGPALAPPVRRSGLRGLASAVWSSSEFEGDALNRFAQPVMRIEAQHGVQMLGALTMLLMAGLALLYYSLGLNSAYVYTFGMLAVLAGHTAISAKLVSDVKVLYLLGMVLLSASGLAFMLLAHRYGVFTTTLFSTVVLLFMVVPLVPWGLREALLASGIVYVIFTASTLSVSRVFTAETLWTLQFLMLTGAMIALTVVTRAVLIRKAHVEARFKLTAVNDELYDLSHRDSLTGAWNRRFLQEQFDQFTARNGKAGQGSCFGLIDIDKFKHLNDTHGHICGDRVLQRLVQVLTDGLLPDDYVVRMGGDEFAMLLRAEDARGRVERALQAFTGPDISCPGLPGLPRVSVGLVHLPPGVKASLEESYLRADKALYAAKEDPALSIVEATFRQQAPA